MIRKVHLDFHTHRDTQDVGRDFDPDLFARTLADAHVNCLATPGKCNYGHVYYAAKIARPHPHLRDPEMFPKTVAACARRGIRVQAYWCLGLDPTAAERHPQWRQLYQDGTHAHWGDCQHMCFASPYIDVVVIPEVLECIERCPGLAGFWFDICLYLDGAFYSDGFEALARERLGSNAEQREARWFLARRVIRERCIQLGRAIRARLPEADNYFNSLVAPGEPENLSLERTHEVENPILFGGPEEMTSHVRWLRAHHAPTVGLVSRFQGPWFDPGTLRTADQMRFDVARTVALGCHVSMGDHRYPDGHLEPEVYRRLGPIYAEVVALVPWLDGSAPCREAVLLSEMRRAEPGQLMPDMVDGVKHAARLLEEIGIQFDIAAVEDEFPKADLVIWPGELPAAPELLARLRKHLEEGGSLLAFGAALQDAADIFCVSPLPWQPPTPGEASGGVSRCDDAAAGPLDADACGPSGHFVRLRPSLGGHAFSQILTGPMRRIEAQDGVEILGDRFAPVSENPPFPGTEPDGPAIVQKGRVIYSAADLLAEDRQSGTPIPREMIGLLCRRLLGAPRVEHDAGPSVAAHLHRSPRGYTLHLVQWASDRWGKQVNPVARFPCLGRIRVHVRIPEAVRAVTLEPGGVPLEFAQDHGEIVFVVAEIRIWQTIGIAVRGKRHGKGTTAVLRGSSGHVRRRRGSNLPPSER